MPRPKQRELLDTLPHSLKETMTAPSVMANLSAETQQLLLGASPENSYDPVLSYRNTHDSLPNLPSSEKGERKDDKKDSESKCVHWNDNDETLK